MANSEASCTDPSVGRLNTRPRAETSLRLQPLPERRQWRFLPSRARPLFCFPLSSQELSPHTHSPTPWLVPLSTSFLLGKPSVTQLMDACKSDLLLSPFFWPSYFASLPPQETTWTKPLPSTLILPSPLLIHSFSEPIIPVFWVLLTLEEILLGLNQRRPIPTTSQCMLYMIMVRPSDLNLLTSSFDIRHMPQGCGCVNRSIHRRIADDVWQDLACCVGD